MEQNLSFEEAMQKLNQIVNKMERGDATLEQSLELFKEGTALVQICSKKLDEAKLLVQKVTADDSGNPVMEDFSDEASV